VSCVVAAVGMTTPVGLDGPSTAASVRAGVPRFAESGILDEHYEPFVVSAVPDSLLPPADDEDDLSTRARRMLRLALPALRQVAGAGADADRLPLLLALPETPPGHETAVGVDFLTELADRTEGAFDIASSRAYPSGRAGALWALAEGISRLESGAAAELLVGGVDSLVDETVLRSMEREGRILAENVGDGFIPGEGACFLRLARGDGRTGSRREALAHIDAAATGRDSGHRYGSATYRGEALASAVQAALAGRSDGANPIRSVFAGLNGEFLGAKEWGVAVIRNRLAFAEEFAISHPADCFGDTGGAHAALLLGLAALGLSAGTTPGPSLVWASSDLEDLGAAVLSAPTQ
jgi:3-oxoacyl-[acyl-carrier-protein] synthase-1